MSFLQQNWRKGHNRFCLEARGVGEKGKGRGPGGRNDPNNVCTYEYMNKKKSTKKKKDSYCMMMLYRRNFSNRQRRERKRERE
jgi:hypothetical protein